MGIEDQRKFEEDFAKRKAELAQLNQSIIQMKYDKNAKIKEGLYGVTSNLIIQGNSGLM
ncbi:hypothetical protein [Sporomusa aerivorans]|uniref:hypothetical protein n=1 Tax=Sporomusa aerivorans TaxID=204936 RepID=UPI00352A3638